MRAVTFALYCGDGRISKAFERLEECFLTNYIYDGRYGVIADLPPSAVFKCVTDSDFSKLIKRELDTLSKRHGRRFFAMLRGRQYNAFALRKGFCRYECEGGFLGTVGSFLHTFEGDFAEFSDVYGESDNIGSTLFFDHNAWDKCGGMLQCDFLGNLENNKKLQTASKNKKTDAVFFSAENQSFCTLNAADFFIHERKQKIVLPNVEETFLLRNAASAAAKHFFKIYDGQTQPPDTIFELSLALCGLVSMRLFSLLGESETLELSDQIIAKMRRVIALVGDLGINGDVFLMLCAAGEGLCEVTTEPEFILIKNEILEIKNILTQMYKTHFGGELSGALSCKEFEFCGKEMGKIARVLTFSMTVGEFLNFLHCDSSEKNGAFNSEVLICAAQCAFGNPFYGFLMKNSEFKARVGLLNYEKTGEKSPETELPGNEIYRVTRVAGEFLNGFSEFRGVKNRLLSCGISVGELPYVAYLEDCAKLQSGNRQKSVCFACDKVCELVLSLAHASRALPELEFKVVTPDTYGIKTLISISPSVKTEQLTTAESLKEIARSEGFFRQLTPFSTLAELRKETKKDYFGRNQ